MQPLQALAAALAVYGAVALLLAADRNVRNRRPAAIGHLVVAVLLLGTAALLWPVGKAIATYEVGRRGQPIADLYFEQLEPARFRVTLTRLPEGRMQVFDVRGAAWRLDARTLTWRGWALEIGGDPRYQLDRLTGLASAGDGAEPQPMATYELGDPLGIAFWQRARSSEQWRHIVEARQVYGANVPMVDGARFLVAFDELTLRARPANATAIAAGSAER
jgi:hypothetical protein